MSGRVARFLVVAGVVATLLVGSAGMAAAAPTRTATVPGTTTFTSAPGLATRLVSRGLLPLPVQGAQIAGVGNLKPVKDFTMSVTFPRVAVEDGGATVRHTGGLTFAHPAAGRAVTLSDFLVVTRGGPTPSASMEVSIDDPAGGRVRLFDIDTASLTITPAGPVLHAATLTLTDEARARLNTRLRTDAFLPHEICGAVDLTTG